MSALQILIREHELIRTYLDTVALSVRRLERGESVPRAFFDNVVRFARGFVDEHHHFKEECVLFDLLARKKGALAEQMEQLRTFAEVEQEHVQAVLEACGGSHSEAASVLGIGRTTLWRKLRQHDA